MDLPINGKMAKLATEAMICGRQMLQLNSPRYAPSCLPARAVVSRANGIEFIEIQPMPIRAKERIKSILSWMKNTDIKPSPPRTRPKRYIVLRWFGLVFDRTIPHSTAEID